MSGQRVGDARKLDTIAAHSAQADEFLSAYESGDDGFSSCFGYSRRRLDARIGANLPPHATGLRLLDIGCGTGHQLRAFALRGFRVAGIDGSPAMLEHARRTCPEAELKQADVAELPFGDASFDWVISIEVLRYLPDFRPALREMVRVLKPGGICLLTATPLLNLNGYALLNRLALAVPFGGLVRLRQYFTTSGRLRRQLAEAGLREVVVEGVYLGPVNWIERLAPRLLRPALRAWEPWDAALADRPVLRDLSNMLLARGVRA